MKVHVNKVASTSGVRSVKWKRREVTRSLRIQQSRVCHSFPQDLIFLLSFFFSSAFHMSSFDLRIKKQLTNESLRFSAIILQQGLKWRILSMKTPQSMLLCNSMLAKRTKYCRLHHAKYQELVVVEVRFLTPKLTEKLQKVQRTMLSLGSSRRQFSFHSLPLTR